jgi:hypothetical protein
MVTTAIYRTRHPTAFLSGVHLGGVEGVDLLESWDEQHVHRQWARTPQGEGFRGWGLKEGLWSWVLGRGISEWA